MATRGYFFSRATAEATSTATAFTNTATLSFTPSDNQSYALFWSCMGQHDDVTTDLLVDFLHNTNSATIGSINVEPRDSTSYFSFGGLGIATFATATGAHTFNIRLGNETATTASRVKDHGITALMLSTGDQFRESVSAVTTTSTAAYQTVATFSFTPSATGDYLVLAYADWAAGATAGLVSSNIRLQGGGTATFYGVATNSDNDNTTFRSWETGVRVAMTTTQWDFSIDVFGATTSLTKTRNHRFVALRFDGFELVDYAEDLSTITVTTTSSATAVSLSATTSAREYLVLGHTLAEAGTNVIDSVGEFLEDDVVVLSSNEEPPASNQQRTIFTNYTKSFTAGTHTFRWSVYGESAANFYRMDESVIALFDLEGTAAAAGTIIPQIMESYRRRRLY